MHFDIILPKFHLSKNSHWQNVAKTKIILLTGCNETLCSDHYVCCNCESKVLKLKGDIFPCNIILSQKRISGCTPMQVIGTLSSHQLLAHYKVLLCEAKLCHIISLFFFRLYDACLCPSHLINLLQIELDYLMQGTC